MQTKKRKKSKAFWNNIKFKYKLTIVNENTLEEVVGLHVSKLNGISVLLSVLTVLFVIASLIVAFTPLRNYLPGYMNSEIRAQLAAVTRILEITINAFLDNDVAAAYRVEPLEELIDNLCDEMKLHHIDRLQTGECTLNHGFAFNDLLTNCERVSDHCSNIAVAMIELESDSFDTHEYINSVMAMHSHSFDEYYSEYSKEFQI